MIKRNYFASYKKYHDDGRHSFSWRHSTFSRTSFFEDVHAAFADSMDDAKEGMANCPGEYDKVHCIAFNRI